MFIIEFRMRGSESWYPADEAGNSGGFELLEFAEKHAEALRVLSPAFEFRVVPK